MVKLRWITHLVFAYMIFAFVWWAVHLWRQNEALFVVEKKLLELQFDAKNQGINQTQLSQTVEYQKIEAKYHSRHKMILGEGIFFTGCLLFGFWALHRNAQREVQLARQKRNFLLSITHELKSPLAGIRLSLETLLKRPDLAREHTEIFCKNGLRETDRLQNLVGDILLAARLEEKWQPHLELIDLQNLVADVLEHLKVRFPNANIAHRFPEKLPPVLADRAGIFSVVQNLIENAVKYSPEGMPVEISAQKTAGGKVQLSVADVGKGIPDAEKKHIFDKFYRLGNEETRQSTGTGLGLFIVWQVVSAHGGKIEVKDNQPQGTIFSIEI